jgi:hypothetical protein
MQEDKSILDAIDPELVDRLAARKAEIEQGSPARPGIVAALALGSVPIALAALSRDAFGQTTALDPNLKAVLDFALALEIFEDEFYKAVLGTSANSAANNAFATARAAAANVPGAVGTLQQIQQHEAAHRATLLALGATNIFGLQVTSTSSSFDFTGGSGSGNGPFKSAGTDLPFLLTVAQCAEDTGVRAYKGQAAKLMPRPDLLEGALRIHSVEARHASRIRRIRRLYGGASSATVRLSGTVRGTGATAAGATGTPPQGAVDLFTLIYGAGNDPLFPAEGNTTQGGINVTTLANTAGYSAESFTEAFDEGLDRAAVVKIVQPFFTTTIS